MLKKIFDRKTAFAKPTEEEVKDREARNKIEDERISRLREAAIACMQTKEFQVYHDRLMDAQGAYSDILRDMDLTLPNALQTVMQLQSDMKAHAFLLIEPTNDATAAGKLSA